MWSRHRWWRSDQSESHCRRSPSASGSPSCNKGQVTTRRHTSSVLVQIPRHVIQIFSVKYFEASMYCCTVTYLTTWIERWERAVVLYLFFFGIDKRYLIVHKTNREIPYWENRFNSSFILWVQWTHQRLSDLSLWRKGYLSRKWKLNFLNPL